jgi:hypothetical protein
VTVACADGGGAVLNADLHAPAVQLDLHPIGPVGRPIDKQAGSKRNEVRKRIGGALCRQTSEQRLSD